MYTPEAMEAALDALRNGSMSLTRAAAAFGIPSTTLWQRAHRLGIDTPMKKDPSSRHWSEDDLRLALDALRAGRISANRASKEYGIPSSTLYKIARKVRSIYRFFIESFFNIYIFFYYTGRDQISGSFQRLTNDLESRRSRFRFLNSFV